MLIFFLLLSARSPTLEGPSKRAWESSEPGIEETVGVGIVEEPPVLEQVDESLATTDVPPPNQAPVILSAAPAVSVPGTTSVTGMFPFRPDTGGVLALLALLMAFCFVRKVPGRSTTWIPGSLLHGRGP